MGVYGLAMPQTAGVGEAGGDRGLVYGVCVCVCSSGTQLHSQKHVVLGLTVVWVVQTLAPFAQTIRTRFRKLVMVSLIRPGEESKSKELAEWLGARFSPAVTCDRGV